ncbi:hypothetical protein DKX38_009687 [Salix brachista]|uniref:E2F/DP family winged-helix DNA-binding domain-containing protein n=1 Tax=Salix brachista TaxID=2182728 RepID=A0A5N5ME40_9ROSI|nr:hypothetical protein DKX38_009687 [Salix brachista]
MVTGGAHLEDGDRHPSSASRRGGGGATTGSWASGQSVSTSGSVGSPSSRSEQAMATPASDNTFLRLNHLDIHADDAATQDAAGNKKKKRGQRAVGADKSGRGLRQFSIKVCEKVESKGTTTYNEHTYAALVSSSTEVADELVAEFADPINSVSTPDQQQYDEKNIRRRVYDALNVLMALDIISKDKKEIQWKGLPRTSLSDIEELKAERLGLRNRIEKKAAYLQELEEQFIGVVTHLLSCPIKFVGLQNLIQRNEQLYSSGNAPSGGVSLPFILVQSPVTLLHLRVLVYALHIASSRHGFAVWKTRPHATVEVEISEDMQLVHFDFNSTPFELHDDNYVLKAMKFCERPQSDDMASNPAADGGEGSSMSNMYQPQILTSPRTNTPVRPPTSPPLPGIIKARVKNEH